MDTGKLIKGALIGGITYFILGFLLYGLLLMDFFAAEVMVEGVFKPEPAEYWPLVLGNISFAAFLTYVFLKTGTGGFGPGSKLGAILAFEQDSARIRPLEQPDDMQER